MPELSKRAATRAPPGTPPVGTDHEGVLPHLHGGLLEAAQQARHAARLYQGVIDRCIIPMHARYPPSGDDWHCQVGSADQGGQEAHRPQDRGDVYALCSHRGQAGARCGRVGGESAAGDYRDILFYEGDSMTTRKTPAAAGKRSALPVGYAGIHGGIVELLDAARQAAARSVNALMTASYWEIGRRIVEAEQKGKRRAGYGEQLMERLSADLTTRFGRGFSPDNLENMRRFFVAYPLFAISETLSRKSGDGLPIENSETVSRKFDLSNWPRSSLCRGRPMSGCCRSRMTMPASSTRPRRCAAAGACANSTGRLEASSTNVRPCPKTRRRCWSRGSGQARGCRHAQ